MAKNWYVLHVYSGYEKRVVTFIDKNVRTSDLGQYIGEVKTPQEEIVEMYNGKKKQISKKLFPGYILIEMDLPHEQQEWKKILNEIKNAPGVTGFIGSERESKPRPISNEEMRHILQREGGQKATGDVLVSKASYNLGDNVKVVDGPFQSFNGTIEEINHEKGKVKVKVEIFGRSTPVELDFLQIEKL